MLSRNSHKHISPSTKFVINTPKPTRGGTRCTYTAPIGIVGTSGGFAGLVLPLSKCLVTGIPRLIGSFQEKEYPSLTVRACDGLSWDTPAGYKLSRAVPAVMWQMGIC